VGFLSASYTTITTLLQLRAVLGAAAAGSSTQIESLASSSPDLSTKHDRSRSSDVAAAGAGPRDAAASDSCFSPQFCNCDDSTGRRS